MMGDVLKDCSDADCHNDSHPFLYFPMCSCSTNVDVVLMQCHNSLKPRLSVLDFFSQLWRKIVMETQGLRLVILDTVICLNELVANMYSTSLSSHTAWSNTTVNRQI